MIKGATSKIPTKGMSREQWLAERRKRIGGSDASTIVGLNRYQSLYSLWAEKMGMLEEKPDTEPMRLGRDLEDYVAKRFTEETGKRVRRENSIILNAMYPFAHANVDRMIVGENAILECKTTSILNLKKFKGTEFPEQYYVQCVHYMMVVPSCERVYLAVLILGKEFKIYVLERDEAEIGALAKAEEEFFENHIKKGIAPPVDGSLASSDALSAVYADAEAEEVDISPLDSVLDSYGILTAQIKALEEQREKLCNEVKQRMQTAQRGESARYVVSWASSERRTFDQKKFRAQFENVNLDQYYKVTKVRTFKVTQKVV